MNARALVLTAGVLALLAGCASSPTARPAPPGRHGEGRPRGEGGRPGGLHGRAMVFISPMGQPFRAGPGEPYPVAAWFTAADLNHDGKLDRAEFVADAMAFFKMLDVNGDGVIDSAENARYETEVAPEILGGYGGPQAASGGAGRGSNGGGRGHGGRMGGGRRGGQAGGGAASGGSSPSATVGGRGAAPYGLLGDSQPVRAADTDLSQTVSQAEFRAAANHRFDRLDTAGKGGLALGDLPQTPVQQRMGRRAAKWG